jgi:hypothetical protein
MTRSLVFPFALVLAAAATLACGGIAQEEVFGLALPDRDQFIEGGVSEFLERRCGAMDCHGQVGRPLRIYSQHGLRLQEGATGERDRSPTSAEERLENYQSTIGLEPEELAISVETRGEYLDHMLFLKPLGLESGGVRHKGGPVLRASDADPGWVCLRTWVGGVVDRARCAEASF